MRAISSTLLAAQRAPSATPHLRVRLYDRDASVARLRWQRWYEGGEPDGPCAAAVPSDGSLVRARIDPTDGALSVSRVAAPDAESDYSSWSTLGSVEAGTRLGLAAAGTRVVLATVQTDGVDIGVRESTDSGATFGSASVVATAGGTVTAVACALQPDGSAAVLFAEGGVVYSVRRTGAGGSWTSAAAWTLSLDAVTGLAAAFEVDYAVLVSGEDGDGISGAWATRLGAGGAAPPGSWAPLVPVALASAGTDVTYLATGLALTDVPRAALVESYAGASAYHRVHLASAVAETALSDFLWRDPRPFTHASPYGLGIAAGADLEDGAWLVAPGGVWHAAVDLDFTDLTADVLEADLAQSLDGGRLRLVLRNDDGRYNALEALAAGGELRFAPGYVTSEGVEVSDGVRCWITGVRRRRSSGAATAEIEAVDGWGLLRAWTAPRQLAWASGERSAFLVLSDLVARAGLHAFGPGSGEATALEPAFTVRPGERGDTAVRRLLATLPDLARMRGVDLVLFDAAADDEADASYGAPATAGASSGYSEPPLLAVAIEDGGQRAGWARVFGDGVFAEAVEEGALASGGGVAIAVDDNLASQPRANARAETLLRRAALETSRGAITVSVHPGHEPGDVVAITDATLGLEAARFRVSEVRLRFDRAARHPRYEQTLSLTEV